MLSVICAPKDRSKTDRQFVPGPGIVAEFVCTAEGAALGDAVVATIDSMADAGRTCAS